MRRFHELPAQEYARLDIGEVNLECAEGLSGSAGNDIAVALRQLDKMAAAVADATARFFGQFEANPKDFEDSAAYFRMLVLTTILQRDFGVTYNVEWFENPPDFTDSRNIFIHGILAGGGGTCSSLPVLYTAVGRRLGYPLKLVSTVSHLFLRWDDPQTGECFNIEATARGLICHSDEHYRTWPKPMLPEDLAKRYYLTSYTPQQELACFYILRAQCYFDCLNFHNAMQLADDACEIFPEEPNFHGLRCIATVLYREQTGLAKHDPTRGVVLERGIERAMEPWERWGAIEAEKSLARLRQIHEVRQVTTKCKV